MTIIKKPNIATTGLDQPNELGEALNSLMVNFGETGRFLNQKESKKAVDSLNMLLSTADTWDSSDDFTTARDAINDTRTILEKHPNVNEIAIARLEALNTKLGHDENTFAITSQINEAFNQLETSLNKSSGSTERYRSDDVGKVLNMIGKVNKESRESMSSANRTQLDSLNEEIRYGVALEQMFDSFDADADNSNGWQLNEMHLKNSHDLYQLGEHKKALNEMIKGKNAIEKEKWDTVSDIHNNNMHNLNEITTRFNSTRRSAGDINKTGRMLDVIRKIDTTGLGSLTAGSMQGQLNVLTKTIEGAVNNIDWDESSTGKAIKNKYDDMAKKGGAPIEALILKVKQEIQTQKNKGAKYKPSELEMQRYFENNVVFFPEGPVGGNAKYEHLGAEWFAQLLYNYEYMHDESKALITVNQVIDGFAPFK